jgi:hypothetical protein
MREKSELIIINQVIKREKLKELLKILSTRGETKTFSMKGT